MYYINAMGVIPWGDLPTVDWDKENEEHATRHGVESWEIDEVIYEGDFECVRHPRWRKSNKYEKRFLLKGRTIGGRRILIVVEQLGPETIRPITAWEL